MQIAFTICSNNYLAHAKVLGESIKRHNQNIKFIVGLCDSYSESVDYSSFYNTEFISIEELKISNLKSLSDKYNIIELNTSIKATLFIRIMERYPSADAICYFDPDICVFSSLGPIYDRLEKSNIVLTPHCLKPIPLDNLEPREYLFQLYGLFNLGFLGLNTKWSGATNFLLWWEERIIKMATTEVDKGYFQDQRWINFAPIYFENVEIIKNPGCNAAPWNLHERDLMYNSVNNTYLISNENLIFFHFSNFKVSYTDKFANFYNRYEYYNASNSVLRLYNEYRLALENSGVNIFSRITPTYGQSVISKIKIEERKKSSLKKAILLFTPPILQSLYFKLKTGLLEQK